MGRVVACRLSQLMAKNNIRSISELERKTGINRVTLTKMYHDESTRMDFGTTTALCLFFGCKVDELYKLVDKEEKNRRDQLILESRERNRKGYVYFFLDLNTGLTKVGKTINIEKRKYQLEYEFNTNLKLLGSIPSENALVLEKEVHNLIGEYRVNGEWFNLPEEEVRVIIKTKKAPGATNTIRAEKI